MSEVWLRPRKQRELSRKAQFFWRERNAFPMPNVSLQTSPNQNPDHDVSNLGVASHPKQVQALQALNRTKGLRTWLKCLRPGWEGREQHLKWEICTLGSSGWAEGSHLHTALQHAAQGSHSPSGCVLPGEQELPPQHCCWGCWQPLQPQQPPRPPYLSPELRLRLSQNEKRQEGDLKPVQPLCCQSWARSS